ncbi:MAG TPA: hypothetical protein VEI97_05635 [bacterium]|nr:hypothetical protein [bacterium]
MAPPFTVLLTADLCNGPFPEHADPARWEAIYGQAALIRRMVLTLTHGQARITWFVRADPTITATLGDPLAHFMRFRQQLEGFLAEGDELGFHPHFYEAEDGVWSPSTDDDANASAFREIGARVRALPYGIMACRIGEAHMTSRLLSAIAEAGFAADCTALPGRVRTEPPTYDWGAAPHTPYRHPNGVWELPFSMCPIAGPTEAEPKPRYVNLGFQPSVLQPALEAWLPDQDYLCAIIHPSEHLPVDESTEVRYPLLAFGAEAIANNLLFLGALAARLGRDIRFETASRYAWSLANSN